MAAVKRGRPVRAEPRLTSATTAATRDLDALCIATIRTLCIDAIEAANSGHPGTPIGIAPVTYTLWQRFLRFDPSDPIWPNRDRFVLSAGHASALLWSLLHLTGVRAVDPEYEILGEPAVSARRPEALPPARLEVPGSSRVPLDERRRDDLGPARAGRRDLGRDGHREPVARRALQPRRVHALRLRRVRAGGRRLHDGGRRVGGRLLRRAPAPVEPLLDLRLEPGHDRGSHRPHVHRGRRRRGSSRTAGTSRRSRTRTTSRQAERAFHAFRAEDERPTLIVVHSHIGYGTPVEDTPKAHGEPLGPDGVKAAKRFFGWPEDARVPRSRRRRRALRGGDRGARRRGPAWLGGCVRGVPQRAIPTWPTRSSACSAARSPTAGMRRSRSSPPTRRGSRAATRRARC